MNKDSANVHQSSRLHACPSSHSPSGRDQPLHIGDVDQHLARVRVYREGVVQEARAGTVDAVHPELRRPEVVPVFVAFLKLVKKCPVVCTGSIKNINSLEREHRKRCVRA